MYVLITVTIMITKNNIHESIINDRKRKEKSLSYFLSCAYTKAYKICFMTLTKKKIKNK